MDQRERTRKLTNTPLPISGAPGDVSPSAPSVGEKLRKETKCKAHWKNFKTVEDWKREFERHPEWAGRSTTAMQKDNRSGALAFYRAFRKFCTAESKGDNATYQNLLESIFPKKHRDWSALTTIGDWKIEFDSHSEWVGRSTNAMVKDQESRAGTFYYAFRKFCRAESNGDKAAYQKLFESIFPRRQKDWSELKTIGDWKSEFVKNSKWAGRSTTKMIRDKESGALSFYAAFQKYCNSQSNGDKALYNKLFESIFPRRNKDWSELETIGDWKSEFDKNPSWAGRSTTKMMRDKRSGANAFYQAFKSFCKVQSNGDKTSYQKLLESIFPKKVTPWSGFKTLDDWKREAGKNPEWTDRSTATMSSNKGSGSIAFYRAFQVFCLVQSGGDKESYQRLFGSIFPRKQKDWSELKTIDDWKSEFDENPKWADRSTTKMVRDKKSGAQAFYMAFRKFCIAQSQGDLGAYRKLLESIFPKKHRDWSELKTIKDWKREFDKNPEWAGKSTAAFKKDFESGAYAFICAFHKFCKAKSGEQGSHKAQLVSRLFPYQEIPRTVALFSSECLPHAVGNDHSAAATAIDKVMSVPGDTYDLKLPSGKTITVYSVQMTSGPIWACTKKEWKTFLSEYGLKEKSKPDDAGSNASLFDLL